MSDEAIDNVYREAEAPEVDAWKQHDELLRKFTPEWTPRADLRVTAHATQRGVEVEIGEVRHDDHPKLGKMPSGRWYDWQSSGKRNVDTMRELALAILAACDFVDASNPVWATRHSRYEVTITPADD